MAIIPLHIVDAFSDEPFHGNPAAIVPNAAVLAEDELVRISEELGLEVGFVLPPRAREADVRLRFFTDRREDFLSGHVLIAAFTSMAERGLFRPTADGHLVHVETLAGVLQVRLVRTRAGRISVTCEMPNPRFGEPIPADEVAQALDVSPDVLRLDGAGPQRVSCGFDQIIVPVADRQVMLGGWKGAASVRQFLDSRGAAGLVLFCPETHDTSAEFQCRFMHPNGRRCEDLASGTSLAAVGAYAVQHGLVPIQESVTIRTEQGLTLGRPTRALVEVRVINDEIHRVELTGTGAVVMRGSFQFQRPGFARTAQA